MFFPLLKLITTLFRMRVGKGFGDLIRHIFEFADDTALLFWQKIAKKAPMIDRCMHKFKPPHIAMLNRVLQEGLNVHFIWWHDGYLHTKTYDFKQRRWFSNGSRFAAEEAVEKDGSARVKRARGLVITPNLDREPTIQ